MLTWTPETDPDPVRLAASDWWNVLVIVACGAVLYWLG